MGDQNQGNDGQCHDARDDGKDQFPDGHIVGFPIKQHVVVQKHGPIGRQRRARRGVDIDGLDSSHGTLIMEGADLRLHGIEVDGAAQK